MDKQDLILLSDILGNTNGHLKRYILSVVYPGIKEDELDKMESRLNVMYVKVRKELLGE